MCKSIYKRFENDFAFVTEYGFKLFCRCEHYEYPGVKYENLNKNIALIIVFDYHKWEFSVTYCSPISDWRSNKEVYLNLLGKGKSYKSQLPTVQNQLRDFLEKDSW